MDSKNYLQMILIQLKFSVTILQNRLLPNQMMKYNLKYNIHINTNSLPTNNVDLLSYVSRHVNSSISFEFTDSNECKCSIIIKNLKITNQDKETVPSRILISNRDFLSIIIISDLINYSISQCVFNDLLKFCNINLREG